MGFPNSELNRETSTGKSLMLTSLRTASLEEPLMTELTRALWMMSEASLTPALTTFSTVRLNSNNSVKSTASTAALHMAVLTTTLTMSLTLLNLASAILRLIRAILTKPITVMMIFMPTIAALMDSAASSKKAAPMDNAMSRTAAPTDNAVSRTAALMDNAVLRKTLTLTTAVLFTVVIVVSVDHTVTAPTAAEAMEAMEAMPIEFNSFNLFVEVLKADKLLL